MAYDSNGNFTYTGTSTFHDDTLAYLATCQSYAKAYKVASRVLNSGYEPSFKNQVGMLLGAIARSGNP